MFFQEQYKYPSFVHGECISLKEKSLKDYTSYAFNSKLDFKQRTNKLYQKLCIHCAFKEKNSGK